MKYIMFERRLAERTVQKIPIIFPSHMVHADVAAALKDQLKMGSTGEVRVVSAGDVCLYATSTHASSSTLGIVSQPNDVSVINLIDYFHGLGE